MTRLPEGASQRDGVSRDDEVGRALDDLFRKEAPRLRRYFRGHMRPGEDVLDFVQEAFVRLAGATGRALPAQPGAYLQRIARNLLIDRSRRRPWSSEVDPIELGERARQEDALHARDTMTLYEKALAGLPERTRMVFLLYRRDGLPYREIAVQLDISISAVQKHFAKALEHITIALQAGE